MADGESIGYGQTSPLIVGHLHIPLTPEEIPPIKTQNLFGQSQKGISPDPKATSLKDYPLFQGQPVVDFSTQDKKELVNKLRFVNFPLGLLPPVNKPAIRGYMIKIMLLDALVVSDCSECKESRGICVCFFHQFLMFPHAGERILCRHPFHQSKRVYVMPQRVEELLKCYWCGNSGKCKCKVVRLHSLSLAKQSSHWGTGMKVAIIFCRGAVVANGAATLYSLT